MCTGTQSTDGKKRNGKEKRVGWRFRGRLSGEDVAAKGKREKTTWNTRKELSDERRSEEDNGENQCELNRPSVYAPTHSPDAYPASDGNRRRTTGEVTRAKDAMEERGRGGSWSGRKVRGACAGEQGGKGEEEWMVEWWPRNPSTSRYAENCARKRGALESCVTHRKWRRADVRMKERASCDACNAPARERGRVSMVDGYKTDRALYAHVHAQRRTPPKTSADALPPRVHPPWRVCLDAEVGVLATYSAAGAMGDCGSRPYAGKSMSIERWCLHPRPVSSASLFKSSEMLCPTRLARWTARQFERPVPGIKGWVSGLRDEKLRRCNAHGGVQ
ncbi:hypothetical protein B0H13DRAFT_1921919 [Mycena leptocephala]|nr:hypothetical protein B0H13DRAFT_1921919 [Mycena leptocephala]